MSKIESDVETGKTLDRIAAFSDAIFAFAMNPLSKESEETRPQGIDGCMETHDFLS